MAEYLALGSYHRSLVRSPRCFREYREPFPSPKASYGTRYNALLPGRHYLGSRSYPGHQSLGNAYSMAAPDAPARHKWPSHRVGGNDPWHLQLDAQTSHSRAQDGSPSHTSHTKCDGVVVLDGRVLLVAHARQG